MRRTQIYLDDDQAVQLDEFAKRAGTTRSGVIREAIDVFLGKGGGQWGADWQEAVRATAGIAPDIPDDHVEGMRASDAQRLAAHDRSP